jgi:hypothetical protein
MGAALAAGLLFVRLLMMGGYGMHLRVDADVSRGAPLAVRHAPVD